MTDPIVNKVAQSNLRIFDLNEFLAHKNKIVSFDIGIQLVDGLMLKEKPFRQFIQSNDWSIYKGNHVAIAEIDHAIIPLWAYMLVATALHPFACTVIVGSPEQMRTHLLEKKIDKIDWSSYKNAKIVIKGCGEENIPATAFVTVINRLVPIASSIMYGEACSTVPIHKKSWAKKSYIKI